MARLRVFRYEVRRWRDGVIADAAEAVASPRCLSDDPVLARRLLDLVGCLPSPVWGRDELGTGEMWNSNSVISWLLARSGLPTDAIRPPAGGRAPGWQAGLVTARHSTSATTAAPPGTHRRIGHAIVDALSGLPLFAAAPLYRHWHLRWGVTDEEVHEPMPGDELIPKASFNATRAITIHASPELIWPWIVQMGYRRAGFYTYALLDNAGFESADRILEQYQRPRSATGCRWPRTSTRRRPSR
jgi:hypothetical protein